MVNSNLLKAKFREKGLTQEEVAKAIGMNPSTLSQKVNNEQGYVFSLDEASKLAELLSIKNTDKVKIFFA